jgi:replicative DNA helicase
MGENQADTVPVLPDVPWSVDGEKLPQVVRAERALVAMLLHHPAAVAAEADKLGVVGEWFFVPAHRILWETLKRRLDAGLPADDVTGLVTELDRTGQLASVGDYAGLMDVLSAESQTAFLGQRLAEMERAWRARRFILQAQKAADAVYKGCDPAAMVHELDGLQKGQDGGSVSLSNAVSMAFEVIHARMLRKGAPLGVSSGFRRLDMALDGLVGGRYYVLGARSGMGKTAFALNVALNVAKVQDERYPGGVLFLTGEMPAEELAMRLLAIESGVNWRVGDVFNKEEKAKLNLLAHAAERLKSVNMRFESVAGWSVERVAAMLRRYARTEKPRLVVLDYLQLLRSEAVRDSSDRVGQVAAVSNALRDFAHAMDFPLLVLAQVNREGMKSAAKDPGKLPTVADLKGSGDIEQDADAVLLLHRPEKCLPHNAKAEDVYKWRGKAFLSVDKNRYGDSPVVELVWEGFCQRFREAVRFVLAKEEEKKEEERE